MAQERKRRFTAEYKAEAVKRLEESGKALQRKTVCPPRWGAAWLIEAAL